MRRKAIAVFLSGDDEQLHGEFLLGIKKHAKERNCNIVCFQGLKNKGIFNSKNKMDKAVIQGECSLFSEVDYHQFDAVVLMGDTIIDEKYKDEIINKALETGLPVINVDDSDERCYCIRYDDTSGMEMVVKHVVEEHGCRIVNFISGFKGNRQSEERIAAYRKVLEENDIPIEEERIGYGEFFTKSVSVMKDMLESKGLPEAVICANDTMAIMVCEYLASLGYEIPRDCIVTGFDGIKEGQFYHPALTTVKRAIFHSGEKAVELALDLIDGKKCERVTWLEPVLVKNQSCGCTPIQGNSFSRVFNILNDSLNEKKLFNENMIQLTSVFSACENVGEIVEAIFPYLWIFKVPYVYFVINEEIYEPKVKNSGDNGVNHKNRVYSEHMIERKWFAWNDKTSPNRVSWKGLFKNHLNAEREAAFMSVIPMYHNERNIGFIMMDITCCLAELSRLSTWMVSICSAIANKCLVTEMQLLIDKLDNMYISDCLTNLDNRFGLHRKAVDMVLDAKRSNRKIYGIGIDLDELKKINDTCGHEAGDNAILQVSNAMKTAAQNQEILSRIGGDEYFVMGYCDSDDMPEKYIDRLNEYLSDYNEQNGLAYKIDCSCGYYVSDVMEDDVESIMRKADVVMYQVKQEKKAKRAAMTDGQ